MLIDLEEAAAAFTSPPKASVCIAGAGVAGLVLAIALADEGIDVHVLEAGGRRFEERSQQIYDAEMAGTKHTGTTAGRFRVFGGSSTRWGGQLLPFTDDIFSPPAALSTVGWPLSAAALEPFYSRIEKIMGTNHLPFSAELASRLGISIPARFESSPELAVRFSKWAPFSHRNLARTLGKKAISSGRITVFLHANVTECLLAPDGSRIEGFLVRNYRGARFRFVARDYVMATGTIETSRLLLASRSVCPNGIGNTHDQLGRHFHDHLSAAVAKLKNRASTSLLSWMAPVFVGDTTHTARIEAGVALRRRLNLLAIMAHVEIAEPADSGISVARHLLQSIQRGELGSVLRDSYRRLPAASLEIAGLVYNAKVRKRRNISSRAAVNIRVSCEQRTHSANRIRLAENSPDELGIPRAVVDWRVSDEEILSMRRYTQWLCRELNTLGEDAIDWDPDVIEGDNERFPPIRDTNHPMGGTVMGLHPTNSVVDTDLRVHGLSNLYIASCSTYPSGGSSNPTFTLMALTLRLAERLKQLARS